MQRRTVHVENDIKLLSIKKIIKEKFIIPSYQRGYRWKAQQVNDLLDDIWEFSQKERKIDEFYCLQPIVVRKNIYKWKFLMVDKSTIKPETRRQLYATWKTSR